MPWQGIVLLESAVTDNELQSIPTLNSTTIRHGSTGAGRAYAVCPLGNVRIVR